jgi:predicted lipoprotein
MKQSLKTVFSLLIIIAVGAGITSCDKDDPTDISGLDPQKSKVITQYIDEVVVPTYKSLADEASSLYTACVTLKGNQTQANIIAACNEWKTARKYWEESEGFLYGAAADYNIDPHIDSWPLDKAQLDLALKNSTLIENMRLNGCNFSGFSTLGYGLLGFHAIEYMIFRDGAPRNINGGTDSDGISYNALSEAELVYCVAIAEDLHNQCIRLEASWAGIGKISAEKKNILEETDLVPSLNYGEAMISAGEPGNVLYKSQIAAYVQILQGASDISDEVGNTKITDPVNSGNVLDVESWYSWNSITDFADNIRSVQHVYLGGLSNTVSPVSVSAYVKSLDANLDSEIQAATVKAITQIEAMPAPFRNNLTVTATASAKAACNDLLVKLEKAIELIQK